MKKILYVTTGMPSLMYTFIDREIRALERAGYRIRVVSRQEPPREEVPESSARHYKDVLYLDRAGTAGLLLDQLRVLASRPKAFLRNLSLVLGEPEVKGPRDRVRLLKHLLEAGHVYCRLKGEGISQVHAHFSNAPTSIALFVSRYLGIPYSFTMHASNIFMDPLMLGTKIRLCKKAVTISKYNKNYLLNRYGYDLDRKIDIIHCGIEPSLFAPVACGKADPPLILAVGRIVEMKGFQYLLDACRILKGKGARFSCAVVGEGEMREGLRRKAAELGLAGMVEFSGTRRQEQVLQLMRQASVFVLPSVIAKDGKRDGIPVALMEAMAMELPVVSTKLVGIPELVEEGKEGLLVEQRNPDALASAVEFLLRNPAIAGEMGSRARRKVLGEFNINDVPRLFHPVFN